MLMATVRLREEIAHDAAAEASSRLQVQQAEANANMATLLGGFAQKEAMLYEQIRHLAARDQLSQDIKAFIGRESGPLLSAIGELTMVRRMSGRGGTASYQRLTYQLGSLQLRVHEERERERERAARGEGKSFVRSRPGSSAYVRSATATQLDGSLLSPLPQGLSETPPSTPGTASTALSSPLADRASSQTSLLPLELLLPRTRSAGPMSLGAPKREAQTESLLARRGKKELVWTGVGGGGQSPGQSPQSQTPPPPRPQVVVLSTSPTSP